MTSSFKALCFFIIAATTLLIQVQCEESVDIKVTSPSDNSTFFKIYQDYTMLDEESVINKRNAISRSSALWPNAIVPFAIASVFTESERRVIIEAMKHWENCTCIRFRERTSQDLYYVMIMSGRPGECRSFIGRIHINFQPQGLTLGPGCVHFSVVIHEIGHALGFYHEHTRTDRDSYIRVNEGNIINGFQSEFNKVTASEATTLGVGYDYASIMHYRPNTFAIQGTNTIQALDSNIPVGNAQELSPLDALKANRLYKCDSVPNRPSTLTLPPANQISIPAGVSCGQVIRVSENGIFETPNYPTHRLNQRCAYVFVAPKGYSVSVRFSPLQLDSTSGCSADYVQIYDGSSISSSSLYRYFGYTDGRICNRDDSRFTFHTSSNILTIYYNTDGQKLLSDTLGLRIIYSIRDINECDNSRCHKCTNEPGSFICECNPGYYLSTAAGTCYDVNECAINNGGCQGNCHNFGGGYRCSCNSGQFLQLDGKSCSSSRPAISPTSLPPGTIIPKTTSGVSTTIAPPVTTAKTTTTPQPVTTVKSTTAPKPVTTANPNIQPAECGGGLRTLTATTGSLQTKNYPNSAYPANTDCEWTIQCPESSTIDITFSNSFRVAGSMPTCPRSQLRISGCNTEYGPFCHLTAPAPINTACNNVKVSFSAGPTVGTTRTGFQLHYSCKLATTQPPSTTIATTLPTTTLPLTTSPPPVTTSPPATTLPPTTTAPPPTTTAPPPTTTAPPPTTAAPLQLPQCGGGFQTLTAASGSLQTQNYPNSAYPVNTNCEWTIQCPDNKVIDISFSDSFRVAGRMPSCPRSRLTISGCGSSYGPYCHLTPPSPFQTTCNQVKVNFEAGPTVGTTRTGFQLNYECK